MLLNNKVIVSGYFNVNGILPMEAILPSPFTCVYISIIAIILQVMLWHVDSAPALKCNSYGLESCLERQCAMELDALHVNVRGGVQCGVCNFF